MEKSSEKHIPSPKHEGNKFIGMMSAVQIRLPSPSIQYKNQANYIYHLDENIDADSEESHCLQKLLTSETPKFLDNQMHNQSEIAYYLTINAPLKTKHSSYSPQQKSKPDLNIIHQWRLSRMVKKSLLGPHWQLEFKRNHKEAKIYALRRILTFNRSQETAKRGKLERLVSIGIRFWLNKSFAALKQYDKDSILFGLSHSVRDNDERSSLLKLESGYKRDNDQKHIALIDSGRNLTVKSHSRSISVNSVHRSQQQSMTQDLSGLILNQAKLHLSIELNNQNRSSNHLPPKNRGSSRNLVVKEEEKGYQLGLNSKKNLVSDKNIHNRRNPAKQSENQEELVTNQRLEHDRRIPQTNQFKRPNNFITRTNQQNCVQLVIVHPYKNQNQNVQANAFHHSNGRISQKRPISLQNRAVNFQISGSNRQVIQTNCLNHNYDYFPEEHLQMRKNMPNVQLEVQNRNRPFSANPKITFTFKDSKDDNPIKQDNQSPKRVTAVVANHERENQKSKPNGENQLLMNIQDRKANHEDYIIEKSPKIKLEVVSPSFSKKNLANKMVSTKRHIEKDRETLIKNKILPDYHQYGYNASNQDLKQNIQLHYSPIPILQDDLLKGQKEYFQASTAQNTQKGHSPRESAYRHEQHYARVRSPKDKIFVTSSPWSRHQKQRYC